MGILSIRRKRVLTTALLYVCLIGGGVTVAFPLLWMFLGSFQPVAQVIQVQPFILPQSFTFENYTLAIERLSMYRLIVNSSIVSAAWVAINLFVCSFAGHIFSKYRFIGKEIIFVFMISGFIVPFYSYIIPLFLLVRDLGWINTYYGIFGPWCVDAFGIFLMRQFMHGIPKEMVESAKIDGASEGRVFFQIVLPLSKPALGVLGIFTFMWSWNSLFWPLIVITKSEMFTLPVGIATFVSNITYFPQLGLTFATGTVMLLPIVIVYLLLHQTFTRSVALTGLK